MRLIKLFLVMSLVVLPSLVMAQTPQITNNDLLQLIGLQQVQNLQCGKSLEATQRELQNLKDKQEQKEKPKGDDSSAH